MPFCSYAQNFEDVLLWRAFKHLDRGFYIDVGAFHPDTDSVTRAFYDRGWSGINVEPVEDFILRLRAARPRDINLQLAVGDISGPADFFVVPATGLESLRDDLASRYAGSGHEVRQVSVQIATLAQICRDYVSADIHFLKIDVEGAERAVLAGADFTTYRPWIVLVEATEPLSSVETQAEWELLLLDAGYEFAWFDGLNRFYIAEEHRAALAPHFRSPPNVFDDFLRVADTEWARRITQAEARAEGLTARAVSAEMRAELATQRWHEASMAGAKAKFLADLRGHELADLHRSLGARLDHHDRHARAMEQRTREAEGWLNAMRRSTSWQITKPLRHIVDLTRKTMRAGVAAEPEDLVLLAERQPTRPAVSASVPAAVRIATPQHGMMREVHQFHSGAAVGDAITNAMLLTRRILREMGYQSEIYVEHRPPALEAELRPMDELPLHANYVLIQRHSMGYDAFPKVALLPASRILLYHNITPPEFLSHAPALQHYARLGREQLAQLRDKVAATLADSDYNAIELGRLGFAAPRSCMLLFDIDAVKAWPKARKERTVFTILFVGRIGASKAQLELLEAFREFRMDFGKPSRLVLVGQSGGAGDSYWQALQDRLHTDGLADDVRLTGLVSDDALHGWYDEADLYVSLSHHEGFGVPLVEAMAHGVPVLAWPCGAVPYTLGGASELLEDRAPESIAARMLDLANDPARRAEISERQRRSLDRFDLESQKARLSVALASAGAAPPVDAGLRSRLSANMSFTLTGHIEGSYSLASVNRSLALSLQAERPGRVRITPLAGQSNPDPAEFPASCRSRIGTLFRRPRAVTGPEVTISQHYPVYVPAERGDVVLAQFFWEESIVSAETVALLNRSFDGVLAPTNFVAKALRESGLTIPLRVFGYAPDLSAFRALAEERRRTITARPPHAPFVFLHVSSCFPRKGVDILLDAYARSFRRSDAVRLVIKGFPNPHNDVAEQIDRLRARDPDAPAVELVDRDLNDDDLLALYREADTMVLPTRGEGFNLPAAEALAAGIPLIVTGYGGHMDFCNSANARLVDYRFALSRSHLAAAHSVWVEPDIADLGAALREAASRGTPPGRSDLFEQRMSRNAMVHRLSDAALDVMLQPPRMPIRIVWITTWDVRCGIAEYSRYLLDSLIRTDEIAGITVLADDRTPPADLEGITVRAIWPYGNPISMPALITAVSAEDPNVVVVQHQPALFGWGTLAALLAAPALRRVATTVTLHNTKHLLEIGEDERYWVVAELAMVSRVIVHTVADLNLLKGLGLVTNVAPFPQGAPPLLAGARPHAASPLIGCYGFFLPGKGVRQLIEALALVRQSRPQARLRLVNAEYDHPDSAAEIALCRDAAAEAGVMDAIEWETDFLPNDRSVALLAECDVVVLPYQRSREASSAALRTALSAGVCVAVTPIALFDEAEDAVFRLQGIDVPAIADGVSGLLVNADQRRRIQHNARKWQEERAWSRIAERMRNMLIGLCEGGQGVARNTPSRDAPGNP